MRTSWCVLLVPQPPVDSCPQDKKQNKSKKRRRGRNFTGAAVAEGDKPAARAHLANCAAMPVPIAMRVNTPDSSSFAADLDAVRSSPASMVVLPKAESPAADAGGATGRRMSNVIATRRTRLTGPRSRASPTRTRAKARRASRWSKTGTRRIVSRSCWLR